MQQRILLTLIAAAAMSLSGCASLFIPSAESMARLPVVRFGEKAPDHQDFITYLPAQTPLPVDAAVQGTLFDQDAKAHMTVTLKKGVYIYKQWISFDDKTWMRGQEGISGTFVIGVPGVKDGSNPGEMKAEFNLK